MLTNNDIRNEALKMAPPAGVSMTSVLGFPLSDWVYIATIAYILVQCGCSLYKTFKKSKEVTKE